MLVFFLSIAMALAISSLCSLCEAVLLSLTPGQIADIEAQNPRIGKIWRRFKENIEKPIAVILILNTSAHTIGATFAGAKFSEIYGNSAITIFSFLFTYFMLQFTEILPKSIGVRFNRKLAVWIVFPLEALMSLLSPVVWFIHFVNRPFETRKSSPISNVSTMEEILALVGLAKLSNQIDINQEKIFKGTTRLGKLRACDVMIPADEITLLSTIQTVAEAIEVAHLDPHTRFPLCEGTNRNHIIGYINFKELIDWANTNLLASSMQGLARPVRFVSPNESVVAILHIFVEQHAHIAVVMEGDRLMGLITMEDIVEELVGELEDEFDRLPRYCHRLSGDTLLIGGGYPVFDVGNKLQIESLQKAQGTISAWFMQRIGKIPKSGESLLEGEYKFVARRIRRKKIFEMMIVKSKNSK